MSEPKNESIVKAFEWLIMLQTILIAIIFEFLSRANSADFPSVAKVMASMTIPLIFSVVSWFWHYLTPTKEREIYFCLFSWGILSMVFVYYIMAFLLLTFIVISEIDWAIGIALIVTLALVAIFPSGRIGKIYREEAEKSTHWENKLKLRITLPYTIGMALAAILIILPFVV